MLLLEIFRSAQWQRVWLDFWSRIMGNLEETEDEAEVSVTNLANTMTSHRL